MLFALPFAFATSPDAEGSLLNADPAGVDARLHAEVGFLAPLAHTIQFDSAGTKFDYLQEGAQDNLFPFVRLSADFDLGERHSLVVLLQPLDLRTETVLQRDITEAGVTFPAYTPLELRYGFTFYRGSWLYDLAPAADRELALGGSLQIRNAAISFASADGTLYTAERDIGPVPLLKVRGRFELPKAQWAGFEVDGAYAPLKYLNGSDTDVVGALLDASVRYGYELRPGVDLFLNLRYLGGGAEGTSQDPDGLGDGFTANWLHFATVSMGATVR